MCDAIDSPNNEITASNNTGNHTADDVRSSANALIYVNGVINGGGIEPGGPQSTAFVCDYNNTIGSASMDLTATVDPLCHSTDINFENSTSDTSGEDTITAPNNGVVASEIITYDPCIAFDSIYGDDTPNESDLMEFGEWAGPSSPPPDTVDENLESIPVTADTIDSPNNETNAENITSNLESTVFISTHDNDTTKGSASMDLTPGADPLCHSADIDSETSPSNSIGKTTTKAADNGMDVSVIIPCRNDSPIEIVPKALGDAVGTLSQSTYTTPENPATIAVHSNVNSTPNVSVDTRASSSSSFAGFDEPTNDKEIDLNFSLDHRYSEEVGKIKTHNISLKLNDSFIFSKTVIELINSTPASLN